MLSPARKGLRGLAPKVYASHRQASCSSNHQSNSKEKEILISPGGTFKVAADPKQVDTVTVTDDDGEGKVTKVDIPVYEVKLELVKTDKANTPLFNMWDGAKIP